MIDYVGIASQFMVLGAGMECIVIMIGYIIQAVFNLMKAR